MHKITYRRYSSGEDIYRLLIDDIPIVIVVIIRYRILGIRRIVYCKLDRMRNPPNGRQPVAHPQVQSGKCRITCPVMLAQQDNSILPQDISALYLRIWRSCSEYVGCTQDPLIAQRIVGYHIEVVLAVMHRGIEYPSSAPHERARSLGPRVAHPSGQLTIVFL